MALESRIKDRSRQVRHEAGSPNADELQRYELCLPDERAVGVVLGMTPELRALAGRHATRSYAIDHSPDAIALYEDWLSPTARARETVLFVNWMSLPTAVPEKADFIVGDGIFGNLLSVPDHRHLLAQIRNTLAPGGRFITRQALAPVTPEPAETLIRRYRQGDLSEAEFGFDLRIKGYWAQAYAREDCLLDCGRVYALIEDDLKSGRLSRDEYEIAQRYVFSGKNMFLPQKLWEDVLVASGFTFERHPLSGRSWYPYYVIYSCEVPPA
ncbi:class I SAM-dependent methyltransferase [Methylobacterium sp. Leaf118]|uniref:class I SAM-dependent methyltransferase n=1 Tax=Methylobacterium sp. Leaf118 TaxID=2876562 RepID=UPI001E4D710E|nr:class I SAM-dependent methyltransferase [Methylobacterium sp. Leaf118]